MSNCNKQIFKLRKFIKPGKQSFLEGFIYGFCLSTGWILVYVILAFFCLMIFSFLSHKDIQPVDIIVLIFITCGAKTIVKFLFGWRAKETKRLRKELNIPDTHHLKRGDIVLFYDAGYKNSCPCVFISKQCGKIKGENDYLFLVAGSLDLVNTKGQLSKTNIGTILKLSLWELMDCKLKIVET